MRFLILSLVLSIMAGSLVAQQTSGYAVGDKALVFNLKNIDGKNVSLNDYKTGAIVVFTCNHCPYAVAYEERVKALDKEFAAKGYPVVAVNPNEQTVEADNLANMQVRAKEKGFTFPYLVDADQSIAKAYGATRTPHVYIVKREGNDFIVKYVGAIDNNTEDANAATELYAKDAINALLANQPVKVASTKAIGCTIKWKKTS